MQYIRYILIFFTILTPGFLHAENRVSVLCYHAFLDNNNPYCFSMNDLRDHLNRLKSEGVTFVSFDDVVNNRVRGTKNVLVTVDDGNRTMYRAWKEVFRPMGIRPVIGIYPAIISRQEYAMTWEQLKEISREGCTVAAHGWFHLFVHKKPKDEKEEKNLWREVSRSRKVLQEKLGIPVNIFVYPFGGVSDLAVDRVRQEGYSWALALGEKDCSLPVGSERIYRMPRYLMTKQGSDTILAKVSGKVQVAHTVGSTSSGKQDRKTATGKGASTPIRYFDQARHKHGPASCPATTGGALTPAKEKSDKSVKEKKITARRSAPGIMPAAFAEETASPMVKKRTVKKKDAQITEPDNEKEKIRPEPKKISAESPEQPVIKAGQEPSVPLHEPGLRIFCRNVIRDADQIYASWLTYIERKLPRKDRQFKKETVLN